MIQKEAQRYKATRRRQFLERVHEAEENLKVGKVKKLTVNSFIKAVSHDVCY